jgi:deoxyuridine 5'-triphosphate nucleotidohydrolase
MLQGDNKVIVRFKKLSEDAIIPTWGHDDDSNAGIDFYSPIDRLMGWNHEATIDLGIAWEPRFQAVKTGPFYCTDWKPAMIIKGRSGLSVIHGIECCNSGVIDSNYRGSITVKLYNTREAEYQIKKGDRIAQGIIILVPVVEIQEASELSESTRGDKGFGSSGR